MVFKTEVLGRLFQVRFLKKIVIDPSRAQKDNKVCSDAIFLNVFLELQLQRRKRGRNDLLFEEGHQLFLIVLRDLNAQVVWNTKVNGLTLIIVLHLDAFEEVFLIKQKKLVLLDLAPDQFLDSKAFLRGFQHFFQKPSIIAPDVEQNGLDFVVFGPFLLKPKVTPLKAKECLHLCCILSKKPINPGSPPKATQIQDALARFAPKKSLWTLLHTCF
jgi:hypothetical protein